MNNTKTCQKNQFHSRIFSPHSVCVCVRARARLHLCIYVFKHFFFVKYKKKHVISLILVKLYNNCVCMYSTYNCWPVLKRVAIIPLANRILKTKVQLCVCTQARASISVGRGRERFTLPSFGLLTGRRPDTLTPLLFTLSSLTRSPPRAHSYTLSGKVKLPVLTAITF